MPKKKPTKEVSSLKVGKPDSSGNMVIDLLAFGNEYAIYEIDTPDLNKKLRVLIDGHSNESEKELIQRFNTVKQGYIRAKGLLYRSPNFGMMKNRVAHTLASALSSEVAPTEDLFDTLINEIDQEATQSVINRLLYISPALLATIFAAILAFYCAPSKDLHFQLAIALFGACLGGFLSILINLNKLHFEEYKWGLYFALGSERVLLALVAGSIALVLIEANILLPDLLPLDVWRTLTIAIVAGFSEQLVPSALTKIVNRTDS